ncbi:MAG: hypothetical protein Q9186_006511 [Xanthomendoza sp. 1 TL-2023]
MRSTFPAVNDLKDNECHICSNDFKKKSEVPIKLTCGHVFGMNCILTWTLEKMDEGQIPCCPACRIPYLSPLDFLGEHQEPAHTAVAHTAAAHTAAAHTTAIHTDAGDTEPLSSQPEELTTAREMLDRYTSGEDSDIHIAEQEKWVIRAEELWEAFSADLLTALDGYEVDSQQLTWSTFRFLHLRIRQAERYSSFGSAYGFYQVYSAGTLEQEGGLPASYHQLLSHLDTAPIVVDGQRDQSGMERWRVYQAFIMPNTVLADHRTELEECLRAFKEDLRSASSSAGQ